MKRWTIGLVLALALAAFACESSSDPADPDAGFTGNDGAGQGDQFAPDVVVPLGEPEWRLVDVGQGPTTGFRGIHGALTSGGYLVGVVGTDAAVFLYDSATGVWDSRPAGEARVLNAIWVEDRDTVYVGGDSGILRRWDASAGARGDWVAESIPDLGDLAADLEILDMWGDRDVAQYICGSNGFIGHWDAAAARWRPDFFPNAELTQGRKLEAVWGSGPDDVWVVGNRIVMRWDGDEWEALSFEAEAQHFHGVWTYEGGPVYAVADGGAVWVLDRPAGASEWTRMATEVRMAQLDIWGFSPEQVFSVGRNSTILRRSSEGWDYSTLKAKPGTPAALQIPANLSLGGIWGSTSDNLFVIAEDGHVVRWASFPVGQ